MIILHYDYVFIFNTHNGNKQIANNEANCYFIEKNIKKHTN